MNMARLSVREREVCLLLGQGYGYRSIAVRLDLTVDQVRYAIRTGREKLRGDA